MIKKVVWTWEMFVEEVDRQLMSKGLPRDIEVDYIDTYLDDVKIRVEEDVGKVSIVD